MQIIFEHHDKRYRCRSEEARSIAIELNFGGAQPNHFGAPIATSSPMKAGSFVGDTTVGGSCNVDMIEINPHCNGTHTETIGHIVSDNVPVGQAALDSLMLATLVTVNTVEADTTSDTYRPKLSATDRVITAGELERVLGEFSVSQPTALIVRTAPNEASKLNRIYSGENPPPFFTVEAMEVILRLGATHLLVDFPSIDRMYDEGRLTNHHLFWNVKETTHQLTEDCRSEKTITEMIYVDDTISDGLLLLNLQVPAFNSDAAPSRPVVWKVES